MLLCWGSRPYNGGMTSRSAFFVAGILTTALLAGCSGGGAASGPTTTPPAQVTAASSSPSAGSVAAETPNTAGTQGSLEAGFAAVALAESTVPGSQAIELDQNRLTWKVVVIAGDQETELVINADGTQVLRSEQERADSDDVRRLAQVQVGIVDAIGTTMASVAGEFDEAGLDTRRGTVVWEVEIRTPQDVEVFVDAATGEIVGR